MNYMISETATVPATMGAGWRLDKIRQRSSELTHALVKEGLIVALGGRRLCMRAERSRAAHAASLAGGEIVQVSDDQIIDAVVKTARQRLDQAAEGGCMRSNGAIAARAALEGRGARIS